MTMGFMFWTETTEGKLVECAGYKDWPENIGIKQKPLRSGDAGILAACSNDWAGIAPQGQSRGSGPDEASHRKQEASSVYTESSSPGTDNSLLCFFHVPWLFFSLVIQSRNVHFFINIRLSPRPVLTLGTDFIS